MTRKPPYIQTRALRHMREAQAAGWSTKALICDYAQRLGLFAQGFDETNAATAIEVVWSRHFAIMPPL